MANSETKWPGDCNECYPEVFTLPPAKNEESSASVLTEKQLKQFFEDGYVLVENLLTEEELEPVKRDIEKLVDQLAEKLYKAGRIKNLHKEAGFYKRLALLNEEFPGANILLHKAGWLPPSFREVLANEKLLDAAEQILGTCEIAAHPVWNLRTKTPNNEATVVPWHQDSGYMENSSYNVLQITGWIPLLDANEHNGCLQLVKGGHRKGKVARHECCYGNTWYVMMDEEEMSRSLGVNMETDVVTLPVPYGGVLLFNNLTPHRSLPNTSDKIRWSLDLRWQRADQPVGFYGVKDGLLLRSKDKNYKVDWTEWSTTDRTKRQLEVLNMEEDEFETSISGPWMKKWKIVHKNQHTDHLEKTKSQGHKP